MNNSKLTTSRITKAMKHEEPKAVRDFASDQRKNVNGIGNAMRQSRAVNGTIPSFTGGKFGKFLKD